jgi:hypothetical protein
MWMYNLANTIQARRGESFFNESHVKFHAIMSSSLLYRDAGRTSEFIQNSFDSLFCEFPMRASLFTETEAKNLFF